MSTLLTPGRAVKWIGDDGGWKVGKALMTFDNPFCTTSVVVQCLDGVHCVEECYIVDLPLRSEYEAAE